MWNFWNSTSRPVAFSSGKIYFYIPVQYTIYCKHRIVYNALVYASLSCMWEGQEQQTWQVCFCLRCKHKIIMGQKANVVIQFSSYSIYAESVDNISLHRHELKQEGRILERKAKYRLRRTMFSIYFAWAQCYVTLSFTFISMLRTIYC